MKYPTILCQKFVIYVIVLGEILSNTVLNAQGTWLNVFFVVKFI